MRIRWLAIALLSVLLLSTPAWALWENEFAISPQAGMVTTSGKLDGYQVYSPEQVERLVDLFLAGAQRDKLDPILDACVATYNELDEDETGRLTLVNFVGGIGPRVNYNTQYVVPYLSLLAGISFLRYKAKWETRSDSFDDENNAHAFGGMAAAGIDFFIHDGLTVGLCGRAGYFASNLTYSHLDTDEGDAGNYGYFAGLFRFTMLF